MDVLWAPWRMAYIKGEKVADCVFCTAARGGDDLSHLVVRRTEHCFVILNAYPYNNGHLMIVPYDHVASLAQLNPATNAALMRVAAEAVEVLRRAMAASGFNLGMNLGKVAGAGIADHLHLHVVPRWEGDTNYMGVVGRTRVIPEALSETCGLVRAAWDDTFPTTDPPAPE